MINLTRRVKSGKIVNCHMNKEVFEMFYDEQQAINACSDDPSLIFSLIKQGYFEVVDALIEKNKVDVNLCDSVGNDVVTRLLKAKQYELVLKLMKKRNWDVNHQNVDGDTFGHILALDNSVSALMIIAQLTKKKNYLPNIRNNKGETVFDRALNNNYMGTAFKILEDKRFNNISVLSFKKLCHASIKNVYYGKYSKLNNLEVIVESLEKKELVPSMKNLVDKLNDNLEDIKKEIINNKGYSVLENIIESSLQEATA